MRAPSAAAVAGKYWAIFRTQLLNSLAYPIDLLGRSLLIILFMWIFMNLWRVTYGATGARLDCRTDVGGHDVVPDDGRGRDAEQSGTFPRQSRSR